MDIQELAIKGVCLITPDKYPDNRGYFFETFNLDKLMSARIFSAETSFCQDNESFSVARVIRGLHYQKEPFAQGKLVRVVSGRVIDVVVDLRNDSPTYGNYMMQELDDKHKRIMWIPKGFAHGFVALEDSLFSYKVSGRYMPSYESGIRWDEPSLNIPWPVQNPIISDKDKKLPFLK